MSLLSFWTDYNLLKSTYPIFKKGTPIKFKGKIIGTIENFKYNKKMKDKIKLTIKTDKENIEKLKKFLKKQLIDKEI